MVEPLLWRKEGNNDRKTLNKELNGAMTRHVLISFPVLNKIPEPTNYKEKKVCSGVQFGRFHSTIQWHHSWDLCQGSTSHHGRNSTKQTCSPLEPG
jgi:hypothetical protein